MPALPQSNTTDVCDLKDRANRACTMCAEEKPSI